MQYIVLDMEWNQPWPGSYAAQKVLPVQIHGEIIQIGAVRLLETGKIADEFQVLVRPKYYKKLNSRVSKLTGLRDARLREEGLSFPEALERFRDWIGGPCIFLTWGFDDITVLEDNILLHDGEPDWITQFCAENEIPVFYKDNLRAHFPDLPPSASPWDDQEDATTEWAAHYMGRFERQV